MAHSPEVIAELEDKANLVRRNIVRIFENSKQGHAGGTMSSVDIVTALYFHHLKLDKKIVIGRQETASCCPKPMPPRLFMRSYRKLVMFQRHAG